MLLRELSLKQDRKRELSQIQRKSVVNALTIRKYIPNGKVKSPIELVAREDAYELQYLFEKKDIDTKRTSISNILRMMFIYFTSIVMGNTEDAFPSSAYLFIKTSIISATTSFSIER